MRTGTSTQPYQYLENSYDSTSKLYDFHARMYDPSTGRFLSEDPISGIPPMSQTMNSYSCSMNNPLAHPDPSGMFPENVPNFGNNYVNNYESGTSSYYLNGRALKMNSSGGGGCDASPGGDGWMPGDGYGNIASYYWAEKSIQPNNAWYENAGYWTGGLFSSLYTSCTSVDTVLTLTPGVGAAKYLGRPFWRYVGPNSNPASRWLGRGWGWGPRYGDDFARAKDKLQMPYMPTGVQKVKVPWYKPVRGPRRVEGNPQWGSGGGTEYYRGWRFPQ